MREAFAPALLGVMQHERGDAIGQTEHWQYIRIRRPAIAIRQDQRIELRRAQGRAFALRDCSAVVLLEP
jgi:hypothetical protein